MSKINKVTQAITIDNPIYLESIVEDAFFKKYLVNKLDTNGHTPLTCAVANNRKKIVDYLVNEGADINKPAWNGLTPLALTILYDSHYMFTHLVYDLKADFYKPVNKQRLMDLAIRNHSSKIFEELLILQVKPISEDILTAVLYDDDNNPAILHKLLDCREDHDLNLNYKNENDVTPIKAAIKLNKLKILRLLIESGADPNYSETFQRWDKQQTPLEIALLWNNFEAVKLLLELGGNVYKYIDGFRNCIREGNVEMFKYLLDKGLDVNMDLKPFEKRRGFPHSEYSFIEIAAKYKKSKMIDLIREYQEREVA